MNNESEIVKCFAMAASAIREAVMQAHQRDRPEQHAALERLLAGGCILRVSLDTGSTEVVVDCVDSRGDARRIASFANSLLQMH